MKNLIVFIAASLSFALVNAQMIPRKAASTPVSPVAASDVAVPVPPIVALSPVVKAPTPTPTPAPAAQSKPPPKVATAPLVLKPKVAATHQAKTIAQPPNYLLTSLTGATASLEKALSTAKTNADVLRAAAVTDAELTKASNGTVSFTKPAKISFSSEQVEVFTSMDFIAPTTGVTLDHVRAISKYLALRGETVRIFVPVQTIDQKAVIDALKLQGVEVVLTTRPEYMVGAFVAHLKTSRTIVLLKPEAEVAKTSSIKAAVSDAASKNTQDICPETKGGFLRDICEATTCKTKSEQFKDHPRCIYWAAFEKSRSASKFD